MQDLISHNAGIDEGASKIGNYIPGVALFRETQFISTDGESASRNIINDNLEEEYYARHLQTALFNIIEDNRTEYHDLENTNRALLNILEDLSVEKEKVVVDNGRLTSANQELEQFVYVASHDLQEPLRMVSLYLQLLEKRYKDKLDKDVNDFIGFAIDGSNRMRALILDLLDYTRVNKVKPFEDIKVNELLEEVLRDLSNQIKENNATINIENLPVIYGDRVLVGQLFQNLISNAVKFKDNRNLIIQISGKKNGGEFLFSIKDNGIGIQKEYADKLFIIFQRLNTKEQYPGTGIGLAICKKIVEKHGGKIWFESEFGQGSTFYFTVKEKGEAQKEETKSNH